MWHSSEKKLGKLSTWVLHVCYFLLGMLLLSFVQAPSYTRWIFLFLVPINLAMDLQQGLAMELPALVSLLFLFSFGGYMLRQFACITLSNFVSLFLFDQDIACFCSLKTDAYIRVEFSRRGFSIVVQRHKRKFDLHPLRMIQSTTFYSTGPWWTMTALTRVEAVRLCLHGTRWYNSNNSSSSSIHIQVYAQSCKRVD